MQSLISVVKHVVCTGATVAGATTIDGTVIDMTQDSAYNGIKLTLHLGDVTDAASINLRLMGSDAADGSTPVVLAETLAVVSAGGTDLDSKLMLLDVRAPTNRYVFSRVIRTVANAVLNSVVAELYAPRKLFVTQGTDVVKSATASLGGTGS